MASRLGHNLCPTYIPASPPYWHSTLVGEVPDDLVAVVADELLPHEIVETAVADEIVE